MYINYSIEGFKNNLYFYEMNEKDIDMNNDELIDNKIANDVECVYNHYQMKHILGNDQWNELNLYLIIIKSKDKTKYLPFNKHVLSKYLKFVIK